MAILDNATFDTTYVSTTGTFADNTTRQISEGDLRQFSDDINDSFVNITDDPMYDVSTAADQFDANIPCFTPNISGAFRTSAAMTSSNILSANSSPITVVAAPGTNYVILPIAFYLHLDYNSAAYATNTSFRFEINGVAVSNTNSTLLTQTADAFTTMYPIDIDTTTALKNQPLKFEVQGGNPTAGNSIIYYTVIYRIVPTLSEA